MPNTPDEIFKQKIDFLAKAEEDLGRRLSIAERKLLRDVIKSLSDLYKSNQIDAITHNQMATEITKTFGVWLAKEYGKLITQLAEDQIKASLLNRDYFYSLELPKTRVDRVYRALRKKTEMSFGFRQVKKGIEVIPGGFLDSLIAESQQSIKVEVLREVSEALATNEGFGATTARIRKLIDRTNSDRGGILSRYYKTHVYDAYAKKDRIESDVYAQEFDLTAFVYRGTVIEKTRSFCKTKAGKVFLRSEARKWKSQNFGGKNDNYNPIRDLGGYNCRHYAQFITNARAIRLRPDLSIKNGKLAA